jgi:hypothetical protein
MMTEFSGVASTGVNRPIVREAKMSARDILQQSKAPGNTTHTLLFQHLGTHSLTHSHSSQHDLWQLMKMLIIYLNHTCCWGKAMLKQWPAFHSGSVLRYCPKKRYQVCVLRYHEGTTHCKSRSAVFLNHLPTSMPSRLISKDSTAQSFKLRQRPWPQR